MAGMPDDETNPPESHITGWKTAVLILAALVAVIWLLFLHKFGTPATGAVL